MPELQRADERDPPGADEGEAGERETTGVVGVQVDDLGDQQVLDSEHPADFREQFGVEEVARLGRADQPAELVGLARLDAPGRRLLRGEGGERLRLLLGDEAERAVVLRHRLVDREVGEDSLARTDVGHDRRQDRDARR